MAPSAFIRFVFNYLESGLIFLILFPPACLMYSHTICGLAVIKIFSGKMWCLVSKNCSLIEINFYKYSHSTHCNVV